jgi:RNA polymerase sigma-70 factor (ECF subfamily)
MTSLESTASLLGSIRAGDAGARDRLVQRFLPPLQRWAHRRLPAYARSLHDTDDLVQMTLLSLLNKVEEFEPRRQGAFIVYARRTLENKIKDVIRQAGRRPGAEPVPEDLPADEPSPLERAIGSESVQAYERALSQLDPEHQEAVVLRMEMGFSWREVGEAIGTSPAAARMSVSRALVRLTGLLDAG